MTITDISSHFGVSRQSYYYMKKMHSTKRKERVILKEKVLEVRKRQPRIGGRKLIYMLQSDFSKAGIKIGRDRFFDFLRGEYMLVRPKRRATRTTRRAARFRQYPNLIQEMKISKPEQVWVSDVTYIHHKGGTSFLHLTTDAYSKKIVGYKLSNNIRAITTLRSIEKALSERQYPKRRLIHHSDRGFNYTAKEFTSFLKRNRIKISMTNKSDPYENSIAERVNGILKDEFSISSSTIYKEEIENVVAMSIKIYNEERPHMSCNYLTPEQAHRYGKYKLRKWSKFKFSKN